MSVTATARQDVQHYLALLYPDVPADAWLVVSWRVAGGLHSHWVPVADRDTATALIADHAAQSDVYLGVGLRYAACVPNPDTRGTNADVCALAGLHVDLDHAGGVHSSPHLPTPDALLAFMHRQPFDWSLVIDSGGGVQGFLLFKEPWLLETPEEQGAAALLLKRFQRTLQLQASAEGWTIDSTADLARILRPAGTLNHKTAPPRPVTILHEDGARYNPSVLADMPWMVTIDETFTPPPTEHNGAPGSGAGASFPPTDLALVQHGCAWMQHCFDDAATLTEPEWYSMLGIVGRCTEGDTAAHEWSLAYPRYTRQETTRKLRQALKAAGPRTCGGIRYDLDADPYCRECVHWGTLKSPIVLGMPVQADPLTGQTMGPVGWSVNGVSGTTITTGIQPAWKDTLFSYKNGEVKQNAFNIGQIIRFHEYWRHPDHQLWFDVIRGYAMCGPQQITKKLATKLTQWFGEVVQLPISNIQLLKECLEAQCDDHPRDLLQLWLNSLPPWDQVPRLTTWFHTITGAEVTPYSEEISRRLPVSMVARAQHPGCPYREVIILECTENIGKSHLVEALASPEWYTILSMSLEGKDSHIMLHKYWIAELSELDSLTRTEEARMKAFITMENDNYVPKYSNVSVSIPRRTIFMGTTNDHGDYLKGQTGNTRYMPIQVGQHIDIQSFLAMREQLFAEALSWYQRHPDDWWHMPDDVMKQAAEERELRRTSTDYEQPLHEWLEYGRFAESVFDNNRPVVFVRNETTWPEIARWFLKIETPERWKDRSLQLQIATALKALGWRSMPVWKHGRVTRIWQKVSVQSTSEVPF